jgi:bifunctional enzyme CysN/CysC
LLCVNKMDLVGYDRDVFGSIREEFAAFASRLDVADLSFIPISALQGDNVVQRSVNMPWYEGASLLHHLEQVYISSDRNLIDPRLPVQWVVRPQATSRPDYRGYAGRIAGGVFRPGDEVMILPSGLTTTVEAIDTFDGPVGEAFPPMSVTVRLTDDVDVSRGDLICRPMNQPTVGQDLDAMVAWMTERPLVPGDFLALKHTTRWVRAVVRDIHYRLDVNTLHRDETPNSLGLNDVGRVSLRVTQPLFYDSYRRNRQTGSFILAAEDTNVTVGAGMLLGPD